LAFENRVLAFENRVLPFENGVLAFEKGVLEIFYACTGPSDQGLYCS
jgi:hypothetical protein